MLLNRERVDFLVAQYVAGSLPPPAHVLMGAHLEMNPPSAHFAEGLEELAGEQLEATPPQPLAARNRALQAIFASPPPTFHMVGTRSDASDTGMPSLLERYAGQDVAHLPWKRKLPGLKQHVIERSRGIEASFLWARPGRALPHHDHNGLELTLVLQGEFRDHRGAFPQGAVSVAEEGLDHRPVAGQVEPCICFSVLFAPIALSRPGMRLIGDLLGL